MYNSRKPKNTFTKMTFELILLDTDRFEGEELIDVLEQIRFDLININLTTYKSNVNVKGYGYAQIGFVNNFYANEEGVYVFDVAISSKYADAVEELKADSEVGITARAFTNKEGHITKIIGLDLRPITK